MTRRLLVLQVVLVVGLGLVLFLPKHIIIRPAAIRTPLPEFVGDWQGSDQAVTQGERDVLGPDTQFDRKLYTRGTDQIYVSIVRSGPDMNTSIHRPERCLPAQGWTIAKSSSVSLPIAHGNLDVTRLDNIRNIPLQDGRTYKLHSLNYYWFVGSSDVTPSHYERTWIDIRDRLLRGENQQWAYVTVAATITKDQRIFGRDEEQTEKLMREFMTQLVPELRMAAGPS